jgi:hypothetical protein
LIGFDRISLDLPSRNALKHFSPKKRTQANIGEHKRIFPHSSARKADRHVAEASAATAASFCIVPSSFLHAPVAVRSTRSPRAAPAICNLQFAI